MKKIRTIVFALIFSATSIFSASAAEYSYFAFSDQIIRQFHLMKKDSLPALDFLAFQLRTAQSPLSEFANQYSGERDAFKKRELASLFENQLQIMMKGEASSRIGVLDGVILEPYDFDKKRFGFCFRIGCTDKPVVPLTIKLGSDRYAIEAFDLPSRIFFSPGESIARKLEALAAKRGRNVPVVLVFEPVKANDTTKWSDGSPYRKILGTIVSVEFLSGYPSSTNTQPAASDVVFVVSKP